MSAHDSDNRQSDEHLVLQTRRDRVAVIELNRPERKNAIIAPMLDQLVSAVVAASSDPDVGAVLLCGAGGAFCSGLDLKAYGADPPPPWLATAPDSVRAAHVAIAECPHPVVVALERYAINGGAAFALAADLLVVGREAWLQIGEVRIGMNAPMNLAWLAARHPTAVALQLVLTGRRFAGDELLRMNIAHEVVDDPDVRQHAEELAAQIAAFPPGAAQALKASLLTFQESPAATPAATWFDRARDVAPTGGPPAPT